MDVVVEVGDWEHDCCGGAVERDQVVDLRCIRWVDPAGQVHLVESHHDTGVHAGERVRGRVVDLHVVEDGVAREVLRVPSGQALTGWDPHDDGHLEDPWTGEVLTTTAREFLVTVRTAEGPGTRA
ncbi:hypothetical protein [Kineococcus sp. SYSU DK004]|uniref:hypothetical protein n=1 Tax=Kineococcus sp. SYSU DK004 TaxID=3383125 RepID=UPI003D7C77D3